MRTLILSIIIGVTFALGIHLLTSDIGGCIRDIRTQHNQRTTILDSIN